MRARNKKQRPISPAKILLVALLLIIFDILLVYIAYTDYNYPRVPALDRYLALLELAAAFLILSVVIALVIYAVILPLFYKGKHLGRKKAKHKGPVSKNALSDKGAEYIEETQSILKGLVKED